MNQRQNDTAAAAAEAFGCLAMILLVVAIIVCSVAALQYAAEEAEKKTEQAKTEFSTIEGKVLSVETKKIPDPFEEEKDKKGIRIRWGKFEPYRTIVKFSDGREKEFMGVYDKPIPSDLYLIIKYDGTDTIRNIEYNTNGNDNLTFLNPTTQEAK